MAKAGFDWLVLDTEHSVLELSEVQAIIQVLDGQQCPAIVRLTSNHPDQIKRVMDAGASGIMVPMIKSAEDARAAVNAVYYPPEGTRGVGLARAQGYGSAFQAYRQWLRDNAVVIAMIEHIQAIEDIDAILSTPVSMPISLAPMICQGRWDDRVSWSILMSRRPSGRYSRPESVITRQAEFMSSNPIRPCCNSVSNRVSPFWDTVWISACSILSAVTI